MTRFKPWFWHYDNMTKLNNILKNKDFILFFYYDKTYDKTYDKIEDRKPKTKKGE